MCSLKSLFTLGLIAAAADLVAGHGAITSATGDAGGTGMALGIDNSTPRDGTGRRPFQQDSTRFRGDSAETFGETIGGGDNQLEAGTQAIMGETGDQLPQITPGGEVQMTLHQVNSDGAGPYTCMINDDGTGATWADIQVTQNLEGSRRGRNRDGEATDFPLNAAIPADQECTGTVAGQDNVCLVRCENPARAGPFGGVVPVQMAGTANATVARRNLARSLRETGIAMRKLRIRAEQLEDFELEEEMEDQQEDAAAATAAGNSNSNSNNNNTNNNNTNNTNNTTATAAAAGRKTAATGKKTTAGKKSA